MLRIHPAVAVVVVDQSQDCIDLAEGTVRVEEIALETAETVLGVVDLEIVVLEIAPETADAGGIARDVEEIVLDAVEETGLDWDTVLETVASVHYVEGTGPGLVEEGAVEHHEACHQPEGGLRLVEHWAHWLQNIQFTLR